MDFACLRQYLAVAPRSSAKEVMDDAVLFLNPGAVILLKILLEMRVNRRTRRTFGEVSSAYSSARPPKWVCTLSSQLWNFYRLSLTQTFSKTQLFLYQFLFSSSQMRRRFYFSLFFNLNSNPNFMKN
jgi:hypothetical protein